jgi:hypothetical protein
MGGLPQLDNMWVDKDDVSADDKVREFKISNPDLETHLRRAHAVTIPYPPTPIPHHIHHTLISQPSMSSDGNHDLAYEYPAGAYPDSPLAVGSESAANIAAAFCQMSIHTPARLSPDGAAACYASLSVVRLGR